MNHQDPPPSSPPPGLTWTEENYRALARFVQSYSGIIMERVAQKGVRERLTQHIQSLGISSIDDYLLLLQSPKSAALRGELISLITVSESYFFRNPDQFRYIARTLLPRLAANRQELGLRREIRVLSAGCSTGEETYSLAAICLWFQRRHPDLAITVVGADINPRNVELARAGIYRDRSFRQVSRDLRHEFGFPLYREIPEGYAVEEELRRFVQFKTLNLKDPDALKCHAGSDIIMCRNVLIYFEETFRNALLQTFQGLLNPGGMLFLGETESLAAVPAGFELVPCLRAYGYRKLHPSGHTP
ncbi:MAG: Chemotaxis protein methyltransferase CheR [Candidatus Ozemobacter sibiricus]|jgi:chemotaxis protein methyltransferase CheR|uniref:protein-glutamate O-methyltransferase n=1 Tax=Candidatus Ozemobacter sibiricus TaxID=2268124 RepID=A0A367ZQL8_9BACT|nr:MAG: Chemotaxis protein methyltransferase CheR [Candidatus Ozemobacter sibiricus]